ncbi:MAG: hypothetical protein JWR63_1000 [Conexibacter sp.]|nr:hypothetical protein [Conexibacter sp.]
MLGNALAWVCLAVFVVPGWFAVRGWNVGRQRASSQPLAEWLPLALAISLAWSGVVVMSKGAAAAAGHIVNGSPSVRVGSWLVLLAVLWLAPLGAGWGLGRWARAGQESWVTTLVMRSGARIIGTVDRETATELVLADITMDGRRHDRVTVSRADVELQLDGRPDPGGEPWPSPGGGRRRPSGNRRVHARS